MVLGPNQLSTGKVLRTNVPKFMLFRPESDVLRFFEQERALRGSSRRKVSAHLPRKHLGRLQL